MKVLKERPLAPRSRAEDFVARVEALKSEFAQLLAGPIQTETDLLQLQSLFEAWDEQYAWLQAELVELRREVELGLALQEDDPRLIGLLGGVELMQETDYIRLAHQRIDEAETADLDAATAEELRNLKIRLARIGNRLQ